MHRQTALVTPALAAYGCLAALYYPTPQASFLEHALVDNLGAYASNFSSAITPCSNYVTEVGQPAANSGRTTAAQWMRVAFHDFVTADVEAGTGGIDASIGFETERGENSGSALNDSFTFWAPFVNDAVSMADLVAMGTVMSMGLFGGQRVPYRPGRADALQADPTTDSIGLTACGHTMGSVHHGGFPDVVPESAVTPNNTNGGSNFDTTRAVFDTKVVHEYIDWTGNKGGPLVTTDNTTTRPDLRLYESDGNATMQALYEMGDDFLGTCVDLMGRMINTVPAGVALGPSIATLEAKPVNVTFDIDGEGNVELSGEIRVLSLASDTELLVQASLITDGGSSESVKRELEPEKGSSVYGQTTYYSFSHPIQQDAVHPVLKINRGAASTASFPLQNVVLPSKTAIEGSQVFFTVAARTSSPVAITISAPMRQQGTLAPKITRHGVDSRPSTEVTVPGYQLWEGSVDLGGPVTGAVSISATTELKSGVVHDVLYLSAGVAGW